MEFDELLITTGVDALVRLVRDRKKIELEEASSALNIGQETLEEWSRVLEEEGIVRLEYHLTHIYLVWVKPTEEQVSSEVESFKEAKKGIEEEVAEVRTKAAEQTTGFGDLRKSFSEFYAKAYPRIEKLEKEVARLPSARALTQNVAAKRQASLAAISSQLEEVKSGVGEAREDLRKLGIGKGASESRGAMEKVERLNGELAAMQAELADLRKRSSRTAPEVALPPVAEMKKKFDAMKKDFDELRSKNARMRADMLSLHESSDVLKGVAESIVGREDRTGGLSQEMKELGAEADALLKKAKDISARVKENEDLTERFESTVNVAKGILTRFPSQEKVMSELDKMQKAEESLSEKAGALETLLEAAGGRQVGAKQFADLARRMDEKAEQMKRDMDSLAGALEDEKATYLTFQKIKERVVPSIEAYQKQLDSLEAEIDKMKSEAEAGAGTMEEDARKLAQTLKGSEAQEAMKAAQEITEKKRMLDEISQSLEDMNTLSENLNKRITLLAREARILEIRTGGEATSETEAKREEVRQELKLSEQEEMEFRKKREELRSLIKKLWE